MAVDFLHDTILDLFLHYARIDTMSDPHVTDHRPTTSGQLVLLELLEDQCRELGIKDIVMDPNGYLIARMPSNTTKPVPPIGFMAHVDVADDVPGNGVKPRVISSYDGNPIRLTAEVTINDPSLQKHLGETIVVADGTTLLGADDKAGIAILMAVGGYLMRHPEIPHGEIEFIFTTDEETGGGMDAFQLENLHSTVCYTLDGGPAPEVEAECFNAATVTVTCVGVPYHLGAARGRMVNSVVMANAFITALPGQESPEATDGRYGYYSVDEIHGKIEETRFIVYVRDFDAARFRQRIETLEALSRMIGQLYPGGDVTTEVSYSYSNMAEGIDENPQVMESLYESAKHMGLELDLKVIRGGTDGARLTQLGIPTPNIFTGGHNYHSKYEYLSMSDASSSALLVTQIVRYWAL
ncbi:MAG: peptidase T [Sphaerochaetaceae bacterium]|nr:peptidase T [Sphaerochaetaceae bacterium]